MSNGIQQITAPDPTKPLKGIGPDGKLYTFKSGTTVQQAKDWFNKKGIKKQDSIITTESKQTKLPNNAKLAENQVRQRIVSSALQRQPHEFLNISKEDAAKLTKEDWQKIQKDYLGKESKWLTEGGLIAMGGGLEKIGITEAEPVGSAILKLLSKIPHAQEFTVGTGKVLSKIKIPLLPSEVNGGLSRYFEQLMTNLIPSAGKMKEFYTGQAEAITKGAETIANALSKFKGTPEEFGVLLQDATKAAKKAAIAKLAPQLSKMSPQNAAAMLEKYVEKPFAKGLLGTIMKSKNVEQLSGALVSPKFGHEEIRDLIKLFSGTDQFHAIEAARTRIVYDVIEQTLRGSKDPTLKRAPELSERFLGKRFTAALDKIGEDRLKTIFTSKQYEAIEKFEKLIAHTTGDQSSFVGRFMNLVFVLGPFRGAMSAGGMGKIALEAGVLNTAARIITSTEGVEAYESYIRAQGKNLPAATKAAYNIFKIQVDKANNEYELEKQKLEQLEKENK